MSNKNTFGIGYLFFIVIAGFLIIVVKNAIIIGLIIGIVLLLTGKLNED